MAQLIKTKGWIFVNDNQLHITVIDKPYWVESKKYWRAKNGTELLPRELFPDMKQEDTPIEVEIIVNSIPTVLSEDLDIDEELERFFESKHLFVDADDLLTVRHCNGSPTDKIYYFEDVARHFAQLQKKQIMKGLCYETKLYKDEEGDGIDTPIESWLALENNEITNIPNIGLKAGDNVKVIIVKDEQLNHKPNIEPPSFEESQGEFNSYNVALNG